MSESKPRSFWGRVNEFVRNPTQDWALTRHENALREQQEQDQVKAKEEQRRLDAFVRRRELASLRRMRHRQAEGLPIEGGMTDVPDTGTGLVEPQPKSGREATLRKINEIERAMADDARPARRPAPPPQQPPSAEQPTIADTQRLGGLLDDATRPQLHDNAPSEPLVFPVTDMATRQELQTSSTVPMLRTHLGDTQLAATQIGSPTQIGATVLAASPLLAPAQRQVETWIKSAGAYGTSPMAVDVQEGVSSSPLFDQACIDFANANDAAAERALLDAISGSPERELENEFWLALFDLYRAGNDPVKFEALVVDYVDRFQSSAPSWSIQPRAGDPAPRPATTGAASGSGFAALGELDAAQSRALLLLARSGARQVSLDFNAMTGITPGAQTFAVDALKTLNSAAGCDIEIAGIGQLIEACTDVAPPMQRDADPAWWALRLEALRLAGSQEGFDAAALDYCVTYEISPPAWEPSRASVSLVRADDAGGGPATQLPSQSMGGNSLFGNTAMGLAVTELRGEIRGGSEDFLKPLDRAIGRHHGVIVNLLGLRRIDFASAAIMLNWVMSQAGAGRSVQFEGTNRLIAGLFVILGINSVAEIHLRKS